MDAESVSRLAESTAVVSGLQEQQHTSSSSAEANGSRRDSMAAGRGELPLTADVALPDGMNT